MYEYLQYFLTYLVTYLVTYSVTYDETVLRNFFRIEILFHFFLR